MTPIPMNNHHLRLPGAVIKVYREAWRAQTEKAALRRLTEARILAPSVLGSGHLRGRQFVVMRRLRGSSMGKNEQAAYRIIRYLQFVHRLAGPGFGRLATPLAPRWNDYLHQRLTCYRNAFVEHGLPEAADIADSVASAPLPEPSAPSLLHNDPEPGNFLHSTGGTAGLDWELAIYGDPCLDYARIGQALEIPPSHLCRILARSGIGYDEQVLMTYRCVHVLGRLMSSITAIPPDMRSVQRHLYDLSTLAAQ
jgi:aminoglycoside phosphotransferase (APT) family kinase protein